MNIKENIIIKFSGLKIILHYFIMATIHVPILLDVSGNVEVFGEKVAAATNFFDAQHYFKVDCATSEGVTVGQLKNLLKFQDADAGAALYTIGHGGTDNGLTEKKALLIGLRKAICGTKAADAAETGECNLIHLVSNSDMPTGVEIGGITGSAGVNGTVLKQNDAAYASSITSATQSEQSLGQAVIRYVSTHLSGHPLGQAFVKNDTALINQLNGGVDETSSSNINSTTKGEESFIVPAKSSAAATATNACLPEQIVNALCSGLSGGNTDAAYNASVTSTHATPASNAIVASIYEQMLGQKADRFESLVDGTTGDQLPTSIPFVAGDVLVLYVRIDVQTEVDSTVLAGNATPSTAILTDIFPPSQFKRMRHTYSHASNADHVVTHNVAALADMTGYTYAHSMLECGTWRIDLKISADS
ncbi:MAG: hypothetical protein CML42_06585 [Rhodobacteraceae bacterium]|nr:hypothetical protein [Paracoccaceae bacterium]|tara:strand:- start:40261 stop:41514 length:1254 start_codon:yes stop_codon:yes gene_type:complete